MHIFTEVKWSKAQIGKLVEIKISSFETPNEINITVLLGLMYVN